MSSLVFPQLPGQGWSVFRRPTFGVQLRTSPSQREVSSILMDKCYYEFDVNWDLLRQRTGFSELTEIEGLFLSMRGSYDYFFFTDPNSYQVTDGGIGTGDGVNTAFVLGRNTGPSYFEAVGYLNQMTAVYINSILVDPADYSFSAPNTIIFDTPPGNGLAVTATFTYYFLCRFGQDSQEYEQFMYKLYQLNTVTLKTVDY